MKGSSFNPLLIQFANQSVFSVELMLSCWFLNWFVNKVLGIFSSRGHLINMAITLCPLKRKPVRYTSALYWSAKYDAEYLEVLLLWKQLEMLWLSIWKVTAGLTFICHSDLIEKVGSQIPVWQNLLSVDSNYDLNHNQPSVVYHRLSIHLPDQQQQRISLPCPQMTDSGEVEQEGGLDFKETFW